MWCFLGGRLINDCLNAWLVIIGEGVIYDDFQFSDLCPPNIRESIRSGGGGREMMNLILDTLNLRYLCVTRCNSDFQRNAFCERGYTCYFLSFSDINLGCLMQ